MFLSMMFVKIRETVVDWSTRQILQKIAYQNTPTHDLTEVSQWAEVADIVINDMEFSFVQEDLVNFPKDPLEKELKADGVNVAQEVVFGVYEFHVPGDLGACIVDVGYDFLQPDAVNAAFVDLTSQKCLYSNETRTNFNMREAAKYIANVNRFCGNSTETTSRDLNRIRKYWVQRHLLFVRFDAGILLDHESFYSVCPEILSKHIAERYCRLPNGTAIDPFCGAGGNIIQLSKTCGKVIAMDIDVGKLKLARHNADIYGCHNIVFQKKDYFNGPIVGRVDVVVTSPPWGGPEYLKRDSYSPSTLCESHGGGEAIVRIARAMAPKVALHLPRTIDKTECVAIAKKLCFTRIKFEENFINDRHNSTTVLFSY